MNFVGSAGGAPGPSTHWEVALTGIAGAAGGPAGAGDVEAGACAASGAAASAQAIPIAAERPEALGKRRKRTVRLYLS